VNGLAGAVLWAVVPFTPEAPFRLYAGPEHAPIEVSDAGKLITAAQRGKDRQFSFIVPGKARPVLIISDAHDADLGELLALRLVRFGKLEADEQELIRAQRSPTHFYLRPDNFEGLPEENAAMIVGLVRVHTSAMDRTPLGRLDAQELAVVHQRLVRHHGFDVRMLVREQLQRLAELKRARGG
jgi:hypothetical protein